MGRENRVNVVLPRNMLEHYRFFCHEHVPLVATVGLRTTPIALSCGTLVIFQISNAIQSLLGFCLAWRDSVHLTRLPPGRRVPHEAGLISIVAWPSCFHRWQTLRQDIMSN